MQDNHKLGEPVGELYECLLSLFLGAVVCVCLDCDARAAGLV
jgi:hypothetical protein